MEHFWKDIKGWATPAEQGVLLNTVLNQINFDRTLSIVEIGVYQGRCTALWNVELINSQIDYEYFAIDHFRGSAEHSKNVDYFQLTINNLRPLLDKINIVQKASIEASKLMPNEYFDIVYIDASHDYKSVKEDILHWLPKVRQGGVICGDDYSPRWLGVIRAVDETLGKVNRSGLRQWWKKKE
jgi:predicted O-methyltransferase YrrM